MFQQTLARRLSFALAAAVALVVANVTMPLFARTGGTAHLPMAGVKMKSGLTLDIDSRGSESTGYRPMRVKLSNFPPTPSTYDRQVRIKFGGKWGNGVYGRLAVSQVIEIPEGATSGEAVIAIPRDIHGNYYMDLEVREGGQRLEDLCSDFLNLNTRGGWGNGDESFPSLLFISSKVPLSAERDKQVASANAQITETAPAYTLPDVRNAVSAIHDANNNIGQSYGQISDRSLLTVLENSSCIELIPPVELPERWIDLSTYTIIFISRGDLQTMAKEHPSRRRAIQEWLAEGCVLVVYDAGKDYEHLGEIEKLLELPPQADAAKKGVPFRDWISATSAEKYRKTKVYGSSNNYYGAKMASTATITTPETGSEAALKKPVPTDKSKPPFVSRPAHVGWLIALPEENPFPGDMANWEWMLQSIPDQRESWSYRHGLSFTAHNDGFWNWHIAGVGAAPVFSFMLLASLFAVAIGPLNYLVLGRIQRLSMLLFTVPAGAFIVTIALFMYAIGTDGLGVRTRVRSYTSLDQQSGQMVSWSRQTYFASVAPSRGLKFPSDTLVYPLMLKPSNERDSFRAIDWEPDGQRLKTGFISSRELQQFMVVRSGQSETKLEVTEKKTSPKLQVRNSLGTKIQFLVLRDSQGNYYAAENLPLDATADPAPAKAEDSRIALDKLIKKQEPEYPEGYDPTLSGNGLTRMFRGAFPTGSPYSPVSTKISLLEKSIRDVSASNVELLDPGTYLALVDVAPDVPMGVTNSKQKESLHLIRGRW